MPYPTDQPCRKHDLVGPQPLPSASAPPPSSSSSSTLLVPDGPWTLNNARSVVGAAEGTGGGSGCEGGGQRRDKVAAVYTYPDAPTDPLPLSRDLVVAGFVDASFGLVRKLVDDERRPPWIVRCAVAVKRADDDRHRSRLDERSLANADSFATLVRSLRDSGAVAILAPDKCGRFGVLRPMTTTRRASDDDAGSSAPSSEDFAAWCYVGPAKELRSMAEAFLVDEKEGEVKGDAAVVLDAGEEGAALATDNGDGEGGGGLWQPPAADGGDGDGDDAGGGLWKPPGADDDDGGSGGADLGAWGAPEMATQTAGKKRPRPDDDGDDGDGERDGDTFHADEGAAAADAFYSGLTRSLDTRADSRLYHMRAFNGWVKATQIAELDPVVKGGGGGTPKRTRRSPLRVLDLACGKGGDLGKWTLHKRGVENYVGVDVARGSLRDAAIRARSMRRSALKRCAFTCADLGSDVPGRRRSDKSRRPQKLLSWSLQSDEEAGTGSHGEPRFDNVTGGGISETDRFDVVSIQFAIHYMMSSRMRARRFFHTVSQLLDVGGNLIATTIDARVVLQHIMGLGADLHFDDDSSGGREGVTVGVGGGVCKLKFDRDIVQKIFAPRRENGTIADDDLFGLQYTFTLVEGSDHSAGVGEAVDLPEWLTPLPVLKSLASEAGLELEYAMNFHEFYASRKDPMSHPAAHIALYNMKVLDRNGSISRQEWEVSRMYVACKFRKVRESRMVLEEEECYPEEEEEEKEEGASVSQKSVTKLGGATHASDTGNQVSNIAPPLADNVTASAMATKMLPIAMMKAKKTAGEELWKTLTSEEKSKRTKEELAKLI